MADLPNTRLLQQLRASGGRDSEREPATQQDRGATAVDSVLVSIAPTIEVTFSSTMLST